MITEQDITLYHKDADKWLKIDAIGTFRNTSIKNRNQAGVDTTDKGLIRIFDYIEVFSGDIVVNKRIDDTEDISLTKLKEKYGRHNVFQVKSVDRHYYNNDLDHVKIGII